MDILLDFIANNGIEGILIVVIAIILFKSKGIVNLSWGGKNPEEK